jgi:mRNA interferase RelE/StbE
MRELARLDKAVGRRIIERINWLATNLDTIRPEAITGELVGFYKLRVGDYRVIYEILHEEQTIVMQAIGRRSEIHRRRQQRWQRINARTTFYEQYAA